MPVATMMLRSTCSLIRTMRGMYRPRPITVGSTIVLIPRDFTSVSFATASATRTSSSQGSG